MKTDGPFFILRTQDKRKTLLQVKAGKVLMEFYGIKRQMLQITYF